MWETRTVEVFFYGLFMDVDALRAKGLRPANARAARVDGFALQIGQRATLAPCADASVHGFVIGLTHAEIDALYADASVGAYRPEAVIAELPDGSAVAALCFNLPAEPNANEANAEYAAKLRELARRLGFPADYVASIQ